MEKKKVERGEKKKKGDSKKHKSSYKGETTSFKCWAG